MRCARSFRELGQGRSRPRGGSSRPGRRTACTLLAFTALLLAGCGEQGGAAQDEPVAQSDLAVRLDALERPSFVLIICDTLRADWTTPYGKPDTTPELARWADRGVVFERVRSQSSWTKVSMASTLTSLWPRSHGIKDSTDGLGQKATTLAEALREAGYRTFGVQTNGWLEQSFGFQQGFESYLFPSGRGAVGVNPSAVWTHAGRVRDEFRRVLEEVSPSPEPFFIYLHLMDVHEYRAPAEYQKFGNGSEGAYLASVRYVDKFVKDVRELLEQSGDAGDTVLVFGSDHGETFGENQRYGHARNVLTAVLHVPLLVRFPFPTEPIRVHPQVRNIDIGPTLLDLAGVPAPESFEGRSLVPLMLEPEANEDRPAFASLREPLYYDTVLQDSVNVGRWTYARNFSRDGEPDGELLFDRKVDPGEIFNLAEREPEQAARLRALLEEHFETKPDSEVVEERVRINPRIANRLRALGYLQDTPIDDEGTSPKEEAPEPERAPR